MRSRLEGGLLRKPPESKIRGLVTDQWSGSLSSRASFVEDLTAEIRIWCQKYHQWWWRWWLENTCQSSVTRSQIIFITGLLTSLGHLNMLRLLSGSWSPSSSTFEFGCSWMWDYGQRAWFIRVQEGWRKQCAENSRTMIISTLSTLAFCSLTSLSSNKLLSWRIIQ